jgi:hypothetical protein
MTGEGVLRCTLSLIVLACVVAAPAQAQAQQAPPSEGRQDEEPNQQDDLDGLELGSVRSGFLEGATLTVKPRVYYLDRDRDTKSDSVGWAAGGAIEFRSGWMADLMQVAATVYTSQVLYGPDRKDGTLLFKPGPESFTALGEANLTVGLGRDNAFRIGRQSFDLPWLARQDVRMAPNTFEAVAVGRPAKVGFAYVAGYVDRIKRKNDDEFISMSDAAGAAGSHKGLALVGAQYTFADSSVITATNQTTFDVMNTFFVKGEKLFRTGSDSSVRLSLQYTDQRSAGSELIGDFATHLLAAKAEVFWKHASLRVAASAAGDDKGLQSPFGGAPNYLSIMVDNFDRAGERALLVGASYDFAGVGLEGLSAFTNIVRGRTPDTGPKASPDETEYDFTIDYRFAQNSPTKGLGVRVRAAWVDQKEGDNGGSDFVDFRIILNYQFEAF